MGVNKLFTATIPFRYISLPEATRYICIGNLETLLLEGLVCAVDIIECWIWKLSLLFRKPTIQFCESSIEVLEPFE